MQQAVESITPEREQFIRYLSEHLPTYTAEHAPLLMSYMERNFKFTAPESAFLLWLLEQRLMNGE
jgi:hypothetical protein